MRAKTVAKLFKDLVIIAKINYFIPGRQCDTDS